MALSEMRGGGFRDTGGHVEVPEVQKVVERRTDAARGEGQGQ